MDNFMDELCSNKAAQVGGGAIAAGTSVLIPSIASNIGLVSGTLATTSFGSVVGGTLLSIGLGPIALLAGGTALIAYGAAEVLNNKK